MNHRGSLLLLVVLCGIFPPALSNLVASTAPQKPRVLLPRALDTGLRNVETIIFCTRGRYDDPHWYANIGYYCDDEKKKAYHANGQPDDSRLYKWNIRTGKLDTLLDAQGGTVRDPQVHYDGRKILFSYRKAGSEFFHLFEINVDGSGLRQFTSGEFDDYEPTYLPDGDIAFVSTRCKRWVNCWMTQVGVIHRCKPDGSRIELISPNTEHDNTPWPLPDGRLLYMRWEYVDRSQVEFHGLWTMNPDGTAATVYYGNMHPHIVMLDAKPIPGSRKVIASFSPGHGANEHAGIATIVSPDGGPDNKGFAKALHQGKLVKDPYALAENCVIAARDNEIVLMDGSGAVESIFSVPGKFIHEPRPVVAHERELVLESRTRPEEPVGRMILADVYNGRNLAGVKRGDIRKLLILESLPKPVNFSGGPDLVSWLGTFTLERVLGTVPVEADGSAHFELPADRQVFFVALDEKDLSVKRMQSWCSVRPGEVISCIGCHEHRSLAPEKAAPKNLLALTRPPSKIKAFENQPDVLDFRRDIQPILDRACVQCHSYERPDGGTILAGDLGPHWSHSFFTMFARQLVADGRNGLGNQPPRTLGSVASKLLTEVDGSHYGATVNAREWRTLWMWIESGAPYVGSYAGLRNQEEQALGGNAAYRLFHEEATIFAARCQRCHGSATNEDNTMPLPHNYEYQRKIRASHAQRPRGAYERIIYDDDPVARFSPNILLNLSRPPKSPLLLGPLAKSAGGWGRCGDVFANTNDPDYKRLLAGIERSKTGVDRIPRYGTPEFKPNPQYIREMKRFGILDPRFDRNRDRIDLFATDEKYWQSLWYRKVH